MCYQRGCGKVPFPDGFRGCQLPCCKVKLLPASSIFHQSSQLVFYVKLWWLCISRTIYYSIAWKTTFVTLALVINKLSRNWNQRIQFHTWTCHSSAFSHSLIVCQSAWSPTSVVWLEAHSASAHTYTHPPALYFLNHPYIFLFLCFCYFFASFGY